MNADQERTLRSKYLVEAHLQKRWKSVGIELRVPWIRRHAGLDWSDYDITRVSRIAMTLDGTDIAKSYDYLLLIELILLSYAISVCGKERLNSAHRRILQTIGEFNQRQVPRMEIVNELINETMHYLASFVRRGGVDQ